MADRQRRDQPVTTTAEHCLHWQDGDGACCRCHEPAWCPEEGENPESLARFAQRRHACTTADAARVAHTRRRPRWATE